ncbi:hypothetical protein ACTA71_001782 [Dictyostelium dimigraforme]
MNNQDYETFLKSQEDGYRVLYSEIDVDIENPSTGLGSQVGTIFETNKKKKSTSKSKTLKKAKESPLRIFFMSIGSGILFGFGSVTIAVLKNCFFKGESTLLF